MPTCLCYSLMPSITTVLSLPGHISCFNRRAHRRVALIHVHWPWARHTIGIQVRQTGQVFTPHSLGCSKSTMDGQATLALEGGTAS